MDDLSEIVKKNKFLYEIIEITSYSKKERFYVGSGAIAQTIWNFIFSNDLNYGIEDIDIVYFNSKDISITGENKTIVHLSHKLNHISYSIDIKNQARVHLWYKEKFGYDISPITSINDAVNRWPTTCTSISLRLDNKKNLEIYAPFGLDDLFSGIVRPNKKQITVEIYNSKVQKWLSKWPELKIIPWN